MIRFKRLPEDIMQRVEGLKEFLEKKLEVIFAYLFGGLTKKKPSFLSDVDIAVYLRDPKRFDYLKFYGEITDFLGTDEVDIVVLNKAPISLTGRILYSKRLLVDKEPFLRHRFESLKIREFLDFQYLERRYFKERYKVG